MSMDDVQVTADDTTTPVVAATAEPETEPAPAEETPAAAEPAA